MNYKKHVGRSLIVALLLSGSLTMNAQKVTYQFKEASLKTALKEVSELYGFPAAAIVSMPEVVEILKEENKLDDDLLSRIDAYYELYGAKE